MEQEWIRIETREYIENFKTENGIGNKIKRKGDSEHNVITKSRQRSRWEISPQIKIYIQGKGSIGGLGLTYTHYYIWHR